MSTAGIAALVDAVDQKFNAGTLEVSPGIGNAPCTRPTGCPSMRLARGAALKAAQHSYKLRSPVDWVQERNARDAHTRHTAVQYTGQA